MMIYDFSLEKNIPLLVQTKRKLKKKGIFSLCNQLPFNYIKIFKWIVLLFLNTRVLGEMQALCSCDYRLF